MHLISVVYRYDQYSITPFAGAVSMWNSNDYRSRYDFLAYALILPNKSVRTLQMQDQALIASVALVVCSSARVSGFALQLCQDGLVLQR